MWCSTVGPSRLPPCSTRSLAICGSVEACLPRYERQAVRMAVGQRPIRGELRRQAGCHEIGCANPNLIAVFLIWTMRDALLHPQMRTVRNHRRHGEVSHDRLVHGRTDRGREILLMQIAELEGREAPAIGNRRV